MSFLFGLAELSEISFFFFKNAFEAFAVEYHSLHCNVRLLEPPKFAFNGLCSLNQGCYYFDSIFIILETHLILIFKIPDFETGINKGFVKLSKLILEKQAERFFGFLL